MVGQFGFVGIGAERKRGENSCLVPRKQLLVITGVYISARKGCVGGGGVWG